MRPAVLSAARRRVTANVVPLLKDASATRGFLTVPIQRSIRTPKHLLPYWRRAQASQFHGLAFSDDSTIYALSTAPGRAGIAIVRISGAGCLDVYRNLCPSKPTPKPRYATLRTIYDPKNSNNVLDSDALVSYFPSPNTVTGEDILELHIHGGPATVKAVLDGVARCSSTGMIRYAEPGEFTRRAFRNGRLDLAQVEALSDTLSAETEQQRRAAVRGNSGKLGRTYEEWRKSLLYARGELEALIDFSEDQQFDESPAELMSNVTAQVREIVQHIATHEAASHRGELLRKGVRISILGPPNAGKSSLLNRIVGREASIVTSEAGTTRDIVEVSLDIQGYLCTLADTAGLRSEPTDISGKPSSVVIGKVEQEGIRRAKAKARDSDIVVVVASIEPTQENGWTIEYDAEAFRLAAAAQDYLIILNKSERVSVEELATLLHGFDEVVSNEIKDFESRKRVVISCKEALSDQSTHTGNISEFIDRLLQAFKGLTELPVDMEDLLGVTTRQRQLLSTCAGHLQDFITEATSPGLADDCDFVVAAEHLRYAADCLSRITGRGAAGDVEEVLGVVFEKFCVGK